MLVGTFKVTFQVDFISVHLATTSRSDLMIELIDPIFEEPIFSSQLYTITNNTVNIGESSQFQMYILYDYPTNQFLRKQCQLVVNIQAASSKVINTRLAGKLKPNFADILNNQDSIYLTVKKHRLSNSSARGQIQMKISVISKEEIKKEQQEIMADKLVDQFVTLSPTKKGKVKVRSFSQKSHEKQLTPQKPNNLGTFNSPSKNQIGKSNFPPKHRGSQKFTKNVQIQKGQLIPKQIQAKQTQIEYKQQQKIKELNRLLQEQKIKSKVIKQQLDKVKQSLKNIEQYQADIKSLTKQKQQWRKREDQLLQKIQALNSTECQKDQRQYYQAKEQNLAIKYQLADCFNQLETIKGNFEKTKQQNDFYVEQVKNLQSQKQKLHRQFQAAKKQYLTTNNQKQDNQQQQGDLYKAEIQMLRSNIISMETSIQEKDQIIERMKIQESQFNNAEEQIFKLQSQLSRKITQVNEAKAIIQKYKKQIQQLEKSINYQANKNLSEENARLKSNQLQQIEDTNRIIQKMQFEHKKEIKTLKAGFRQQQQHFRKQLDKNSLKIEMLEKNEKKYLEKEFQMKKIIQQFQKQYSKMLRLIQQKQISQALELQKIRKYQETVGDLELKVIDLQAKQNYIYELEDNILKYQEKIRHLEHIINKNEVSWLKTNGSIPENSQQSMIEQTLMFELNHMKKSYEKLIGEIDKKEQAYQNSQTQIGNLWDEIKIRQGIIQQLQTKMKEKDQQTAKIVEEKNQLEAVLIKKNSSSPKRMNVAQMQQLIKIQKNKIDKLERFKQQAQIKIVELQQAAKRKSQQVNFVEVDSYALHENMNNIEAERQRLQIENRKLRATVLDKITQVPALKTQKIPKDNLQFSFKPKKNQENTTNLKRQNQMLKLQLQQYKAKVELLYQPDSTQNRNNSSPAKKQNFLPKSNRTTQSSISQTLKQLGPFIKELINNLSDRSKRLRIEQVIETLNGYKIKLQEQQQKYREKVLIQERARALSMQFQQLKLFIVQNKEIGRLRNQLLSLLKRSENQVNQLVKISETLAQQAMKFPEEEMQ